MKDFLGNEYDVGDKVLYAAMSGRSVTMVLAEVVRIFEAPQYGFAEFELQELKPENKEIHVTVKPLKSSRWWKQHYGQDYYVDTRSGKSLDPFVGRNLGNPDIWAKPPGYYNDQGNRVNDADVSHALRNSLHYEADLQPYIEQRNDGPEPVTLSVTDNVVLWQRKDAELHPEWEACKR